MRCLFVLCFLFLAEITSAQNSWLVNVQGGSLMAHRESIRPLITDHLLGAELQWSKRLSGKENWHQLYRLPALGISFTYADLGNENAIGKQFALTPFIELLIGKDKRALEQHLQFGLGIGYTDKVWDLQENLKGLVLSSHFNASIFLQYALKGDFSFLGDEERSRNRSLFWSAGVRLHHFSNASWKMPNLGTNNLLAFAGIGLKMGEAPVQKVADKSFSRVKRFVLSYGIGFRENNPPLGVKHAMHTLRLEALQRISPKSSIGLSPEILYNRSLEALLRRDGATHEVQDLLQAGIAAHYALHFSRMTFNGMVGAYVFNQSDYRGTLYYRVGLRYAITPKLSSHLMLKTHAFKADHAEVGIAYRLGQF